MRDDLKVTSVCGICSKSLWAGRSRWMKTLSIQKSIWTLICLCGQVFWMRTKYLMLSFTWDTQHRKLSCYSQMASSQTCKCFRTYSNCVVRWFSGIFLSQQPAFLERFVIKYQWETSQLEKGKRICHITLQILLSLHWLMLQLCMQIQFAFPRSIVQRQVHWNKWRYMDTT